MRTLIISRRILRSGITPIFRGAPFAGGSTFGIGWQFANKEVGSTPDLAQRLSAAAKGNQAGPTIP